MYRGYKVAVSIPAYNEELLIAKTVETVPDFVDMIVVTNDGSKDRTLEILHGLAEENKRLAVFDNDRNHGVGYTVVFFFSSRRRHTRSLHDWSSDVCSSD